MRRFTQTFVLGAQSPKQYYVHNDIFRYQVCQQSFVINCGLQVYVTSLTRTVMLGLQNSQS